MTMKPLLAAFTLVVAFTVPATASAMHLKNPHGDMTIHSPVCAPNVLLG